MHSQSMQRTSKVNNVTDDQAPWGRVDETGTVFVREASGERAVGQYPDGTPEEALAYFERKFTELAGQVTLLEQRVKRGAPAADVAKAVATLTASIATANAVGDLAALQARIEALSGTFGELTEKQIGRGEGARRRGSRRARSARRRGGDARGC